MLVYRRVISNNWPYKKNDLFMKSGGFFHSYVGKHQRVYIMYIYIYVKISENIIEIHDVHTCF